MANIKKLTILHSNDLHGDFLEEEVDAQLIGGVSMLSGYVGKVRREEKNAIYCIAGDMFRGSVIDSEFRGISTIEIMNMLSPDVVTIGKGGISLCREGFIAAELLDKFGYSTVLGGRTDVVALRERGLEKDCCNIGCGYYNAHRSDEYTLFSHLQNALAFVSEVVDSLLE